VVALRICKWVAMSPWFVMLEFVIKCNSESWCRWDLAMSAPSSLLNLLHDSLDLVDLKFSSYKNTWEKSSNHCIGDAHFMMTYKSVDASFTLPYFYESNYWPHSCKQRFFYWWIFAKFQPEKYDLNLCKGFFLMKKTAQICQISKKKSKFPEILW
jgi:hypothetical protein